MRTMADYRQLNDALFHAGLGSGSQYEWKDEANRRVSVSVDGAGWEAGVQNALVAIPAGESAGVQVFAHRVSGAAASARVTVTIISESDPTKRAVAVTEVRW